MVGMSTRSTQTAAQYVSIGLQTDNLPSSRASGLHTKTWSPRPSSVSTSSLVSARTRQISTSLDKVHSRIERPCCSPKYGSPKLQRRVSSGNFLLGILHFHNFSSIVSWWFKYSYLSLGSTSRLDGSSSSSRDRSLWNIPQRTLGGGGGSAWARSTTTRDSPVLSGLTDGLSSLFSVVEHAGSTESLWRSDGGTSVLTWLDKSLTVVVVETVVSLGNTCTSRIMKHWPLGHIFPNRIAVSFWKWVPQFMTFFVCLCKSSISKMFTLLN